MGQYDLIVIGTGPAGEKGAAQAAYFNKKVAIIEREAVVGGACVNTGTIPSKTLRESALHLSGFRQRELLGVDIDLKKDISAADFMRRKQQVVEREWTLIEDNLRRHRVHRYHGRARFASANEIDVVSEEGELRLIGQVILIATGSSPYHPPGIPFDHQFVYDSDSILTIDRIPHSLAVVGAGVIGCEYASIFAALGVDVHLVDGRTSLLPHIDREISNRLLMQMTSRLKVHLHLGAEVSSVQKGMSDVTLTLTDGTIVEADKVLYAAGRNSNTADLNLDAAGVVTGKRGVIPVDERYRTNVPNVYAAGDVIGFPSLASTSMEQARVAMVHAFDLKYKTAVATLLPYGIYTIPEVATAGLTEEECGERGINYEVGRAYFRNNARGQIIGDTEGMIKIIFDVDTLKMYGVHVVGENASELLHVGLMVMHLGGTINSFINTVFNYPTLGDAYKYAAYDGLGNLERRTTPLEDRPMRQIAEIIQDKPLFHASSTDDVRSVVKMMAEKNIGAVAVLDGDALAGMFTERDLMTRVIARDLDPATTTISTVMTRDLATASPEDGIADCLQKMHALNCRHLPVVAGGKLIGMISLRDLLQMDNQRARAKVQLLGDLVTYSPDYES